MQVKKQQLELDMEQTDSKLGKEYNKAICCHLAYLTYMQSTGSKCAGFSSYGLWALECGLSSCGTRDQLLHST
jgi:hypothetical protein